MKNSRGVEAESVQTSQTPNNLTTIDLTNEAVSVYGTDNNKVEVHNYNQT